MYWYYLYTFVLVVFAGFFALAFLTISAAIPVSAHVGNRSMLVAICSAAVSGVLSKILIALIRRRLKLRSLNRNTSAIAATRLPKDKGADMGASASSQAALVAYNEMILSLLDKEGAYMEGPPLCRAALYGCTEMAKLLLGKGADINAKGQYGMTALHFATYAGHVEMVRLLLAKGANVNAGSVEGYTPLRLIADPSIARVYAPFSPMKASASVDESKAVIIILKAHGGTI